jgi:hypothetical protein
VRLAAAAPPRRPEPVEQQRAAEALLRRVRFFGTHAPRDKENHPASPKSESEHTAETPTMEYPSAFRQPAAMPGRVERLNEFFEIYRSDDEYDRAAITHVMACSSHFPGYLICRQDYWTAWALL